jgi:hypothetical protein
MGRRPVDPGFPSVSAASMTSQSTVESSHEIVFGRVA